MSLIADMDDALADILSAFPDCRLHRDGRVEEVCLSMPANLLPKVCLRLRDDATCLFRQCTDICGVDYPGRPRRFDVVYHLLSFKHNLRLRLKIETDEETPVPSVGDIWPSALWYERECWDLYGVFFSGHPDLRRLLTDYGFEGHPLRKDFPLSGFVEPRYDSEQRRVVYEPVKLVQEYRSFDFTSPWEGIGMVSGRGGDGDASAPDQLPGDEKASTSGTDGAS